MWSPKISPVTSNILNPNSLNVWWHNQSLYGYTKPGELKREAYPNQRWFQELIYCSTSREDETQTQKYLKSSQCDTTVKIDSLLCLASVLKSSSRNSISSIIWLSLILFGSMPCSKSVKIFTTDFWNPWQAYFPLSKLFCRIGAYLIVLI